ncbi:MAG TPA: TlyA family RNA methyltransferase [Chloroflexota bacterium]
MKKRLDLLLVERGLAASREQARSTIMAGLVSVGGQIVDKPGSLVDEGTTPIVQPAQRYVSRGGLKLEHALDAFGLHVAGLVAVDIGASTGGFTDCLLQRGVARVYAVDVGYGQLDWRLRNDPRVVVLERTNVRYLEALPEPVDLAAIDASFISLRLVVPAAVRLLRKGGRIVALVKPQFEAGRGRVGKGGVVRDPGVHQEVLSHLGTWAAKEGYGILRVTTSPIRGPAGNVEFLALMEPGMPNAADLEPQVTAALQEATALQGQ